MRTLCFAAAAALLTSSALAQAPAPAPAAPPAASGKTEVTWWGHAAFVIKTAAGTTIAIDPFLKNPLAPKDAKPPEALDAILVTHGHSDHVGDARALADRTGAVVISSFELVALIGARNGSGANAGGTIAVKDDVTVTLVEAVHSSGFGDDPAKRQYAGAPLGFVVTVKGGPTIYHAGDTDVFASMQLIGDRYKPTVGLFPIGGHFTMDPAGAGLAAKMTGVKTVIPMHFGTFPLLAGTPAQLRDGLKKARSNAAVVELKPGETRAF
jgi:L-ascorbate metabolism protein UlaG (beta-lactamase superfamily)